MSLIYWCKGTVNQNDFAGGFNFKQKPNIVNGGPFGKAMSFKRAGVLPLTQPTVPDYFPMESTPWTIAFWMKADSKSVGDKQTIFHIGPKDGKDANVAFIYNHKTNFALGHSMKVLDGPDEGIRYIDKWVHIAISFDGVYRQFYINGSPYDSKMMMSNISLKSGVFNIGCDGNGDNLYDGMLSDFRIYNHALSTKEMTELGSAKVLHWKLNGEFGNEVYDISGNGNNGVIIGKDIKAVHDPILNTNVLDFGLGTLKNQRVESVNDFPVMDGPFTVMCLAYLEHKGGWDKPLVSCSTKQDYTKGWGLYSGWMTDIHFDAGGTHGVSKSSEDGIYGGWYWYTGTYNPETKNINCYLGDKKVYSSRGKDSNFAEMTKLLVGMSARSKTQTLSGKVAEVIVYATEARYGTVGERVATVGSISDKGELFAKSFLELGQPINGHSINIPYTNWVVGKRGTQTGYVANGSAAENIIAVHKNPNNVDDVVWEASKTDVASDSDGGWNGSHVTVKDTYPYRFSVWIQRKVMGNGSVYLGCYSNLGNAVESMAGAANANPYFYSGGVPAGTTEWLLYVGMVYPAHSTSEFLVDGVFKKDGTKVADCTAFRWKPGTGTAMLRSYLYYSTNTTTVQLFYRPRIDRIDGFEPTLQELLSCHEHVPLLPYYTSNNFDKAKFKVGMKENGEFSAGQFQERVNILGPLSDAMKSGTTPPSNMWRAYDQGKCKCTYVAGEKAFRVVRDKNLVYPASGHVQWGGFIVSFNDDVGGCKQYEPLKPNTCYLMSVMVKGKSDNVSENPYLSIDAGYTSKGGMETCGGSTNGLVPANFNSSTYVRKLAVMTTDNKSFWKFGNGQQSMPTTTRYYCAREIKFVGWGYTSTGANGTDVYIKDPEMFEISSAEKAEIAKYGDAALFKIYESMKVQCKQIQVL